MKTKTENLGKVSITVEKDFWNIDKAYDRLTIVERQGTSGAYISRKAVPVGVSITDRNYWISIGKWSDIPYPEIDPVPTRYSTNSVQSGGVFDALQMQDAIEASFSDDGKIYNNYKAGDIFYIEQDGVHKYRVAYFDGTADEEHPITIDGLHFYFANNAPDALWLSIRIKNVSTEQQQLTSTQKSTARKNIAAVAYEKQELTSAQQVQLQNNMMGKKYAPANFSGLGKKVFAKNVQAVGGVNKNIMTQAFFEDEQGNPLTNTVFVIQYDYDLNGENIQIPAGCTLNFDGGSITNGTIFSNKTKIINIPYKLNVIGTIFNTAGEMITYKGDVVHHQTRLLYPISIFITPDEDPSYDWLYDEYGISTQVKGSRDIGISECYVDILINIDSEGNISFYDQHSVEYIIDFLKSQGVFYSVWGVRFCHRGSVSLSPSLFMPALKTFELNVLQGLKDAGLEFNNVFFACERENWVIETTPDNEYIPYLIEIAQGISALGYTPYIDATNWYRLTQTDTRLLPYTNLSYNQYPNISMMDENTVYTPSLMDSCINEKRSIDGKHMKDVGICESGTNNRQKALRLPSHSIVSDLGNIWTGAKVIFAMVLRDFIHRYNPPFYGIWYNESLTDRFYPQDLDKLYDIYLTY